MAETRVERGQQQSVTGSPIAHVRVFSCGVPGHDFIKRFPFADAAPKSHSPSGHKVTRADLRALEDRRERVSGELGVVGYKKIFRPKDAANHPGHRAILPGGPVNARMQGLRIVGTVGGERHVHGIHPGNSAVGIGFVDAHDCFGAVRVHERIVVDQEEYVRRCQPHALIALKSARSPFGLDIAPLDRRPPLGPGARPVFGHIPHDLSPTRFPVRAGIHNHHFHRQPCLLKRQTETARQDMPSVVCGDHQRPCQFLSTI
jgi:hypothetical protein